MSKVKCRCCGKSIDKKIAVGVPHNKQTWYYCIEHVGQKSPKDKMYDLVFEIFDRKVLNTILYKELDSIANLYTYEKMTAYIQENRSYLEQVMNKDFSSEYAQIRYFAAILKNSLSDYVVKKVEPVIKKNVHFDADMMVNNYKQKQQRKGIDDLLNDLLD